MRLLSEIDLYEYKSPSYELKERANIRKPDTSTGKKNSRFYLEGSKWKSKAEPKKEISLMFTGDLLCQENIISTSNREGGYDFSSCFDYIRPLFKTADFVAGNLETPIFPEAPYRGEIITHEGPLYCNAPIEYLEALKYAGFDMLTTANNHTLDTGAQGLYETICNIEDFNMIQTGTFKKKGDKFVIVDICGFKIGFTAFSTSYNDMETNMTTKGKIALLNTYTQSRAQTVYDGMKAQGAEYVICFPHWGAEYTTNLSPRQKKIAQELSAIGYDLIVGSHSHVVQKFHRIIADNREVPIIYSLGNLITHMRFGADRMDSQYPVVMNLILSREEGRIKSLVKFVPCRIVRNVDNAAYTVIPHLKDFPLSLEASKKIAGTSENVRRLIGDEATFEDDYPLDKETILQMKESAANRTLAPKKTYHSMSTISADEIIYQLRNKIENLNCNLYVPKDKSSVYFVYEDHAELVSFLPGFEVTSAKKEIENKPVTIITGDLGYKVDSRVIYMTHNIKIIEKKAFSGFQRLESVRFFKGIEEIKSEAFSHCPVFTGAILPSGLQSIGSRAFANCPKLKSIKIPNSVYHIAKDAFADCPNLIVYCEEKSYADAYAKEAGIKVKYMPLEKTNKEEKKAIIQDTKYTKPTEKPIESYLDTGYAVMGPLNGPLDKHPSTILNTCVILGFPLPQNAVCGNPPSKYIVPGSLPNTATGLYKILSSYCSLELEEFKKCFRSFKRKFNSQDCLDHNDTDLAVYFCDWMLTARDRGFTHNCYFDYELYNKEPDIRETFLNEGYRIRVHKACATPGYGHVLLNKAHFNTRFSKFVNRSWIDASKCTFEEFSAFVDRYPRFFGKPVKGTGGAGARVIERDSDTLENLYDLCRKEELILEEIVRQHKELAEFNDSTLNTVRVNTLLCADGTVRIVLATARFGRAGNCVDNFHGGGVGAIVDIDTGIIITEAIDRGHNRSAVHPDSKKAILGFQYPHWDKIKEAVCESAAKLPEMRNIGWDVSITEKSEVEFIEGNGRPNYDVLQSPDQIGRRFRYEPYLPAIEAMKGIEYHLPPFQMPEPIKRSTPEAAPEPTAAKKLWDTFFGKSGISGNNSSKNNLMKSYWKYFKKANEAEGRLKKKYYTWKARRIQDKYTCYMPVSKRISQFKTPHGLSGIIIEPGTRIRKGCTICNNVSILTKHGSPEIGRNVYIATGAVIQGGITIGNNCRIGPNKVITKDVPAGTILE